MKTVRMAHTAGNKVADVPEQSVKAFEKKGWFIQEEGEPFKLKAKQPQSHQGGGSNDLLKRITELDRENTQLKEALTKETLRADAAEEDLNKVLMEMQTKNADQDSEGEADSNSKEDSQDPSEETPLSETEKKKQLSAIAKTKNADKLLARLEEAKDPEVKEAIEKRLNEIE